jgi:hypothetical protein
VAKEPKPPCPRQGHGARARTWQDVVEGQIARRPREDERPIDWSRTTGGLERKLDEVKSWIYAPLRLWVSG